MDPQNLITLLIILVSNIFTCVQSQTSDLTSWANRNETGKEFGGLWMVDDQLTEGPDPSSKLIGRARGLYGSAGQTDFGLIMALSYVFTDGVYDGSSFSLLSFNPVMKSGREMAVVGGTGLFRLARGYAVANTYQANASGDAIVGYNVTIVTYV
ncbi:dirigent protein 23-like [Salvia divinorum]|uniref:Dirigent protein n=1 Tax=Salvia divinorum TaxID=28513 RepID=A0ABD1I6C2_SALDI